MNYISERRNFQISATNEQLCQEIAEYELIGNELNDSLSLPHTSLESAPTGVIVFNCKGDTFSFNQKFREMWQVPDLIMKSRNPKQLLAFCSNLLKDPTTLTKRVQELPNQPDIEIYDVVELKDGRIFEQHSKPLQLGQDIIGRVWSFPDITERRRTQENLLEAIAVQFQKHNAFWEDSATESQQSAKPMFAHNTAFFADSKSIFPSSPQLSEVFEFIEANYHQPITLSGVAQAVGYSPAYLTDLVRRQTGQTVNRWIVERRIAAACTLLLETNRSVDQIATAVGYQNIGH
ncbi:MAG TPA: helix-turn-helix domain-containing protein, partial [Cyanophyceae cyanobacterium]